MHIEKNIESFELVLIERIVSCWEQIISLEKAMSPDKVIPLSLDNLSTHVRTVWA